MMRTARLDYVAGRTPAPIVPGSGRRYRDLPAPAIDPVSNPAPVARPFAHVDVPRILRQYLRRTGKTVVGLAREWGVAKSTMWCWINGDYRPSAARLARIAALVPPE